MGDILYSLYFVYQYLAAHRINIEQACFNIPLQVPFRQSSYKEGVNLPSQTGRFLQILLSNQGFSITHKRKQQLTSNYIDLDKFRNPNINHLGGDIRQWYYQIIPQHLPKDFSRALFTNIEETIPGLEDKILITKTSRYLNPYIDWKLLYRFSSHLLFIGLPYQHSDFCKSFFPLEYIKPVDGVETVKLLKSSKGFIGSASGLTAFAQCLKVPRVLISSEWKSYRIPGPDVILPIGGWNQVVRLNEKLVPSVQALLENER